MPRGLFLLTAASFSAALHVWLSRGLLFAVPRTPEAAAEYVFISASFGGLGVLTVVVLACLTLVHAVLRQLEKTDAPQAPLLSIEDTAYARPLLLFGVSSLALLNLVPGLGRVLSVWSYALVDLRWWWTPLILFWVLVRIDQRLHGTVRAAAARLLQKMAARRWAPEAAIVALAVAWVVVGTSNLRFSGVTAGDEAKYLRYCELLYQGQGFELSHIQPIAELPADYRPALGRNLTLMAQTLPDELRSLEGDIGIFIRDPLHHFNKADKARGRFFRGKNGGEYQVHSPGISFLMFPAYYLDRQFGGPGRRADSQWPDRLIAINGFFLGLYAVWVALFFRFARRVVQSAWAASITTIALMLTMPVAAFPFQFYPELAAGVLSIWVAGHILFPERSGTAASAFAGVLAGYLPWLHVRFSAVAMVLIVSGVIALRRSPRRSAAFLIGSMASLGSLALYAYHLTGSVLPWAMWQEESGRAVLSMQGAIRGSTEYLVDRNWGLLAHAPVYLLALPGYWLLARRRPDVALLCVVTFLSLLLPSAAHTLTAAGSTPMRLIVAVVPFAAIPLAELLVARGHVPLVRVVFALLLLLSLDTALAYNLHHYKSRGLLEDWSVSGWKTNLLFPDRSREDWTVFGPDLWLLFSWILASIMLLTITEPRHRSEAYSWRVSSVAAACVAVFILLGSVISASTGIWQGGRYLIPVRIAAEQASTMLDDIGQCSICVSSSRGRLDTDSMRVALLEIAPARKR